MLEAYEDLLTVEETCEALRTSRNTVYALLRSGTLRGYRNGRTWRIPKLAGQEFILSQARLKI